MAIPASPALGALIRQKRQDQGLSHAALGALVGVHRVNVIKHEQANRFPKQTLAAYVDVLGITADELTEATGMDDDRLADLGVTFAEPELAVPVATPFFMREQINPKWFRPVDRTAFGA
jgi:transcriptional regulator with XRE-family HTH domain